MVIPLRSAQVALRSARVSRPRRRMDRRSPRFARLSCTCSSTNDYSRFWETCGPPSGGVRRPAPSASHDAPEGWVDQDYLGVERTYYQPVDRGFEAELKRRVEEQRARRERPNDAT